MGVVMVKLILDAQTKSAFAIHPFYTMPFKSRCGFFPRPKKAWTARTRCASFSAPKRETNTLLVLGQAIPSRRRTRRG
jgi:hypothetical protein